MIFLLSLSILGISIFLIIKASKLKLFRGHLFSNAVKIILVKIYYSVVLLLIQLIFLWNRTFLYCLDKLSFNAVNFIRSENNLALLQLFMLLGLSELML